MEGEDGLRWDEDEWVASVSPPDVALRCVLPGRTVESVSVVVPVPVTVSVPVPVHVPVLVRGEKVEKE